MTSPADSFFEALADSCIGRPGTETLTAAHYPMHDDELSSTLKGGLYDGRRRRRGSRSLDDDRRAYGRIFEV